MAGIILVPERPEYEGDNQEFCLHPLEIKTESALIFHLLLRVELGVDELSNLQSGAEYCLLYPIKLLPDRAHVPLLDSSISPANQLLLTLMSC